MSVILRPFVKCLRGRCVIRMASPSDGFPVIPNFHVYLLSFYRCHRRGELVNLRENRFQSSGWFSSVVHGRCLPCLYPHQLLLCVSLSCSVCSSSSLERCAHLLVCGESWRIVTNSQVWFTVSHAKLADSHLQGTSVDPHVMSDILL